MRMAACLMLGVATLTACSDDPSRPTPSFSFAGGFGGVVHVAEDGIGIRILDGTLEGDPVEGEEFTVYVSGQFRDVWGHSYDPDEISIGTPISGTAENCFETDHLTCGADWVIVDVPTAGTG